jgi:dTDP-4-dehydrorhamnose 3,5-epimerase
MKFSPCPLDGVLLIEPAIFEDQRGFFLESFEEDRYHKAGITERFVQSNQSRSKKHVLRGMHFTKRKPQAQLLTVFRGTIFDVVVDLRKESPSFGKWFGTELGDGTTRQIYIPHGFAHGFCVLSDWADLHYKVSQRYDPHDEGGLIWNDGDLAIDWPIKNPVVSERDARYTPLKSLSRDQLPSFTITGLLCHD